MKANQAFHLAQQTLLIALVLLGSLVLTLLVFRLPVGPSLKLIEEGAFGDRFGWSRSAVKMTPLLLTGLGMVIAWRAGMYNIGGEGQFVVGGLCGATVAKFAMTSPASVPPLITSTLILVACVIGGAIWAWLSAWLFVKRGVEVVISTILLNFVAIQVLGWASSGPLQESKHEVPLTEQLPDFLMLPRLDRQMDLHAGFGIALIVAIGIQIYLFSTRSGFMLRLAGDNPWVARAKRINASKTQVLAMMISGGLCGLAGGVEYTGLAGQLGSGFSQQWGFLGIPVALLGGLNPLGVILSAGYFGALFAGSDNLARFTDAGTTLIYVIQSAAVLAFVAIQGRRNKARPQEE